MKYAGLMVMPTGFFLAVAALILLPGTGMRAAFVVCGLVVELLGLAVAVRGHMELRQEAHPDLHLPGGAGASRGTGRP